MLPVGEEAEKCPENRELWSEGETSRMGADSGSCNTVKLFAAEPCKATVKVDVDHQSRRRLVKIRRALSEARQRHRTWAAACPGSLSAWLAFSLDHDQRRRFRRGISCNPADTEPQTRERTAQPCVGLVAL